MHKSFVYAGAMCAMLAFGQSAHAVTLVSYEFQGLPGSQTTVTPSFTATNLTGVNFGETGVTATGGGNSINSTGWNSASAAYTFGFSVSSGYVASVDQLVLSSRSSGTGPGFLSVQASINGGSYATIASITQANTTYNDEMLSFAPLTGITSGVAFRIVAANQVSAAGGTIASGGTFRIGDYNPSGTATPFTINGLVAAVSSGPSTVPEPASLLVLAASVAGLLGMRRRAH